jgi:four helix bundle protein
MNRDQMRQRTKEFVLGVLRMTESIPPTAVGRPILAQMIRSATSVGSNYRAVCRSRSNAEFISKLSIVIEEADETAYWLELLVDLDLGSKTTLDPLLSETNELIAIFVASRKTVQSGSRNRTPSRS